MKQKTHIKNQGSFQYLTGGYSTLMMAVEAGDMEMVGKCLKPQEINRKNEVSYRKHGYSALALAVKSGNFDIANYLLSYRPNINSQNNVRVMQGGQSILFLSCWLNNLEMAKLLIQNGAQIDLPDNRGWTPLIISAYHGYIDIVLELLQSGANPNHRDSVNYKQFGKRAIDRTSNKQIKQILRGRPNSCTPTQHPSKPLAPTQIPQKYSTSQVTFTESTPRSYSKASTPKLSKSQTPLPTPTPTPKPEAPTKPSNPDFRQISIIKTQLDEYIEGNIGLILGSSQEFYQKNVVEEVYKRLIKAEEFLFQSIREGLRQEGGRVFEEQCQIISDLICKKLDTQLPAPQPPQFDLNFKAYPAKTVPKFPNPPSITREIKHLLVRDLKPGRVFGGNLESFFQSYIEEYIVDIHNKAWNM